jgi:hypothetical protein
MMDLLAELQPETVSVAGFALANVNTPAEWRQFDERPE